MGEFKYCSPICISILIYHHDAYYQLNTHEFRASFSFFLSKKSALPEIIILTIIRNLNTIQTIVKVFYKSEGAIGVVRGKCRSKFWGSTWEKITVECRGHRLNYFRRRVV